MNKQQRDPAALGDMIPVVTAYGNDQNDTSEGGAGNVCFEAWCKPGDTFFISSLTPGAIKFSGFYFIPDGMFMWGLTELRNQANATRSGVQLRRYLRSGFGQSALLTTGAQNLFYSNGGVVDDHEYGNDYPQGGQGGGGADLPYASPDTPYTAPAGHHRSALWGRMTGTWANQDSSFTTGGLTFDTGFAQHDYGLLAGIEMRPPTDNSGWRLGLFGGWTSSGLTFSSYGASANYNGGTVGAYAAYPTARSISMPSSRPISWASTTARLRFRRAPTRPTSAS